MPLRPLRPDELKAVFASPRTAPAQDIPEGIPIGEPVKAPRRVSVPIRDEPAEAFGARGLPLAPAQQQALLQEARRAEAGGLAQDLAAARGTYVPIPGMVTEGAAQLPTITGNPVEAWLTRLPQLARSTAKGAEWAARHGGLETTADVMAGLGELAGNAAEATEYRPTVSWEEAKKNPELLPLFGLEAGIASAPDMALAVTTLPGYMLARTFELAEERAKANGRREPNAGDMAGGFATSGASALLERIGGRGILFGTGARTTGGRVVGAAGREAGTEATQELTETIGTRAGTEAGMPSTAETLDRMAAGLVAGGATGTAGRAIVEPFQRPLSNRGVRDEPAVEINLPTEQQDAMRRARQAQMATRLAATRAATIEQAPGGGVPATVPAPFEMQGRPATVPPGVAVTPPPPRQLEAPGPVQLPATRPVAARQRPTAPIEAPAVTPDVIALPDAVEAQQETPTARPEPQPLAAAPSGPSDTDKRNAASAILEDIYPHQATEQQQRNLMTALGVEDMAAAERELDRIGWTPEAREAARPEPPAGVEPEVRREASEEPAGPAAPYPDRPHVWPYEEYSQFSRQLARTYTRAELEKQAARLEGNRSRLNASHLRAIEATGSMTGQSQRRAQSRNAMTGNMEDLKFRQDALEIYDLYPGQTKEGQTATESKPARRTRTLRSLFQFLRSRGGVQDTTGELKAMDLHKLRGKPLVRPKGLKPDMAREAAVEAGYLPEGASLADFYQAMDREARGDKVYLPEDAAAVGEKQSEAESRIKVSVRIKPLALFMAILLTIRKRDAETKLACSDHRKTLI